MQWNEDEGVVEATLHVFIDDLEKGLAGISDTTFHLGSEKELPNADEYIGRYVKSRLTMMENEAPLEITLLGKEMSDDLTAYYVHFFFPWKGTELICQQRLLTEIYDDQKNMVSIKVKDEEKYVLYDKRKIKQQLF